MYHRGKGSSLLCAVLSRWPVEMQGVCGAQEWLKKREAGSLVVRVEKWDSGTGRSVPFELLWGGPFGSL